MMRRSRNLKTESHGEPARLRQSGDETRLSMALSTFDDKVSIADTSAEKILRSVLAGPERTNNVRVKRHNLSLATAMGLLVIGAFIGAAVATVAVTINNRRIESVPGPVARPLVVKRSTSPRRNTAVPAAIPEVDLRPTEVHTPAQSNVAPPAGQKKRLAYVEAHSPVLEPAPVLQPAPILTPEPAPDPASPTSVPSEYPMNLELLSAEANLMVESTRNLSKGGDLAEAVRLAKIYRQTYPKGRFSDDATAIEITGIYRMGQRQAALDAIAAHVKTAGRLPVALRVLRADILADSNCLDAFLDYDVVVRAGTGGPLGRRALAGKALVGVRCAERRTAILDLERYLERYPDGPEAKEVKKALEHERFRLQVPMAP